MHPFLSPVFVIFMQFSRKLDKLLVTAFRVGTLSRREDYFLICYWRVMAMAGPKICQEFFQLCLCLIFGRRKSFLWGH